MNEYEKTPKGKYIRQRANALRRGIKWLMTFEEWWRLWQKSGKWEQRGRQPEDFFMIRKNETGDYSADNVEIKTLSEAVLDSWRIRNKLKDKELVRFVRESAWDYPYTNDWASKYKKETDDN